MCRVRRADGLAFFLKMRRAKGTVSTLLGVPLCRFADGLVLGPQEVHRADLTVEDGFLSSESQDGNKERWRLPQWLLGSLALKRCASFRKTWLVDF